MYFPRGGRGGTRRGHLPARALGLIAADGADRASWLLTAMVLGAGLMAYAVPENGVAPIHSRAREAMMFGRRRGMIDWYDMAPAIAFAMIAGSLAHFIGGKPGWAVLLGVAYITVSGFVAAAAVTFAGLDGIIGLAASVAVTAILVTPLWLYTDASERTPVTDAEITETVAQAQALLALDGKAWHDDELLDYVSFVRGHLEHIAWRLPPAASRRQEVVELRNRLRERSAVAQQ